MENLTHYIASGILEMYALDQLNDQERAEVSKMLAQHPILQEELELIELSFEKMALQNKVTPTPELKEKIMSQFNFTQEENITMQPLPVAETTQNTKYVDAIITRIKTYKYALIACICLLVISFAALISSYKKLNNLSEQLIAANASKTQITAVNNRLEFENSGMENMLAMTQSKEWKTISLQGVNKNEGAKMLVYWNDKSSEVIINYAAMKLPKPAENHEFQLWAIVKKKPISLGVFKSTELATKAILTMEKVQNAEAFAVTIEPMGGRPSPTMEKLVVMGKLTI